jgi:hypothetical protein
MTTKKNITAAAFMATFSSAGRIANKRCVACKHEPARWDSIYCSDRCRREFLAFTPEGR